jgi:hypothetical protein
MRTLVAACACVAFCPGLGARASGADDPGSDLDAIPTSVFNAKPPPAPALRATRAESRVFLESALTTWRNRSNLLVPAPNVQPGYQERLSLDASYQWKATDALRFSLSDRLNAFAGDAISWPSSGSLRNDLREAFASDEVASQTYVEVGRINLKNGPALGYNPTDFFKARAQVNLASIDPSASKQDRLGVLMMYGQKLLAGGAFTVAFAPGVRHVTRQLTGAPAPFDPLFGQTNSSPRYLASLSCDLAGLNPQVLGFHDSVGTHLGASLSRVMSNSVVMYAEWSGCEEGTLSRRAIAFEEATGSIPSGSPVIPQSSTSEGFQNDAAVGVSWTNSSRMTLNVEFHYHQSGFTRREFDQWITLGRSHTQLAAELWFVRRYAADQAEPLMQQQIFARLDWQDAFLKYLDLGVVGFINPFDRSTLAQLSVQYDLSKHWTLGFYETAAFGSSNQEKGSIPWAKNSAFQIIRYF